MIQFGKVHTVQKFDGEQIMLQYATDDSEKQEEPETFVKMYRHEKRKKENVAVRSMPPIGV